MALAIVEQTECEEAWVVGPFAVCLYRGQWVQVALPRSCQFYMVMWDKACPVP